MPYLCQLDELWLDETIRWTTGIAPEYMIGVGSTVSIVMHVRFAPKADK
jgi:hypothetical protein